MLASMNDYAVYLSTVFTVDSMELILVTLKLKYFFIPGILIHYGSSLSLNQPTIPAYLYKNMIYLSNDFTNTTAK